MSKTKVSVVIPTFQERENLAILLPMLKRELVASNRLHELIVVDDFSDDGTEELSRRIFDEVEHRLIVRKNERGLATAVLRGFDEARGDVVVVMDADLSHPPEAVPELVDAIENSQSAMALGSRYVPGGTIDPGWSITRRIASRVASLLARPLTRVRDPMSGFFACRKSSVPHHHDLNPRGFKIGLELLVKGNVRQVEEIPIHFSDRVHGESKLSPWQILEYLRHVGRLYLWRAGRCRAGHRT